MQIINPFLKKFGIGVASEEWGKQEGTRQIAPCDLGAPCLKGIPMGLPEALQVVGDKASKENFKEGHLHGSIDPTHAWSL